MNILISFHELSKVKGGTFLGLKTDNALIGDIVSNPKSYLA